MPQKIRVLDELTINQIAAGEVIENPASVVKELVDNSIDAGATEICVEIKGGGRQLIRITDNGCGMNADDALLCLERHATSKISNVDDIQSLFTMGFRGEAIPSIASISKFTLITAQNNIDQEIGSVTGTMVIVDGGKVIQCCPAARSPGTTIEVHSLFFNVPVRKKFQKSPSVDVTEIQKMLSLLALANPYITFQLISDGKTLLKTSYNNRSELIEDLSDRIPEVLGKEFARALIPVDVTSPDFSLKGYVGVPTFNRNNRTGQHLFINRRPVYSQIISFAVKEGYGPSLAPNRYPVFVLHLDIPGDLVDVNVHPQKKEVRLRQEQQIREKITQAVEDALSANSGAFTSELMPSFACLEVPTHYAVEEKKEFIIDKPIETEKSWSDSYKSFDLPKKTPLNNSYKAIVQEEPSLFSNQTQEIKPVNAVKIIGTIPRYIIIDANSLSYDATSPIYNQTWGGLCLIDQKAAHSRVIYEKLIESQDTNKEIQPLLVPYVFEVTPLEGALLKENNDELKKLGIEIHQTSPNSYTLDALPAIFGNTDLSRFVSEILLCLNESKFEGFKEFERKISYGASQAAISQKVRLNSEEAQKLVESLFSCKYPYQCPLNKSTMIYITPEELLKKFSRGSYDK